MNNKQFYAIKASQEKKIKKLCPELLNNSGIYIFKREDEYGIKYCYCGQAKQLIVRIAAHLREYDHIALSLKKHGFYSSGNALGWKIEYKYCTLDSLDDEEERAIKEQAQKGYQLYNKTLGRQGKGKKVLHQEPTKKYRDGVKQGEENVRKFIANLFNKHLIYKPKSSKPNKNQEKAMLKLTDFLENGLPHK